MANTTDSLASFSYEAFDRQLHCFQQAIDMLVEGWQDLSVQEMSFDVLSLCVKASRLCCLADQDHALQYGDTIPCRKAENEKQFHKMEKLVKEKLVPFIFGIIDDIQAHKLLEGHETAVYSFKLSYVFPRISDVLEMEGTSKERIQELQGLILMLEKMIGDEDPLLLEQMSTIPTISLGQGAAEPSSPADPAEYADPADILVMMCLCDMLRLFSLTTYILLHFIRVCDVANRPLEADAVIRITESKVQKYMSEEAGKHQLDLYLERLHYENDGKPLSVDQWLKARRELKSLVPPKFELAFLYYADDPSRAGSELARLSYTPQEFEPLLDVLAKYQLVTRRIYEISHPEEQAHSLPNEAFNWVVNGKNVDMQELRKSIGKMAMLVKRKNQWFCVWSVLKHLNVLRDDCNFATFAHQMMSKEWFGATEGILPFSADNLSDYSHYFNEYDYTDWTEEMFLEKKELYGMTKWSPKLYATFSSLCAQMMKAIWGYRFLGVD